ncbi:MAG: lasso RiPP family leader peptide-containing protein [Gaiellaceae bacterium]
MRKQPIAPDTQYEPPAVVELGAVAELTQLGVGYPSCEY